MDPKNAAETIRLVVDTNVLLDWLLFDDPVGREIGRAITSGEVRWFATPPMRDEHFEALHRRMLQRWAPDPAAHRRAWDAHCRLNDVPGAAASIHARCADPDDQMFVDLALALQPAWILSRDNALLALAAPLRPHGVWVVTPSAWLDQRAAAEATARVEPEGPPSGRVAAP